MTWRSDAGLSRLWARADAFLYAAVAAAVFAAATDVTAVIWVVLAAVAARVAVHLGVAVVSYRRTMRRPWPAVEPLREDDEW